jgi:hypothetical protein
MASVNCEENRNGVFRKMKVGVVFLKLPEIVVAASIQLTPTFLIEKSLLPLSAALQSEHLSQNFH